MSVAIDLLRLFEEYMVQQLLDRLPKVVFVLFQGVADIERFHCRKHLFEQILLVYWGKLIEALVVVFPMLAFLVFRTESWIMLDS